MTDDIVFVVSTTMLTIIVAVVLTLWSKKSTDKLIVAEKNSTDNLILRVANCLTESQVESMNKGIEAIKADGEATRKAILAAHMSIKSELKKE